jgi:hypothetical protein
MVGHRASQLGLFTADQPYLDIEARPSTESTLQSFRSQLVIHQQAQAIFRRSLEFARQTGYLRGRQMKAVDTTIILGRGAVEDTYDLIGHGIAKLCRVLAAVAGQEAAVWAAGHELGRFFASSLKGEADLDWDDAAAREAFLNGLITDGQRCLALAREARSGLASGSDEDEQIRQPAELLTQLLWQDVEPTARGHQIRRGTAADCVPSVGAPEQRHGHRTRAGSFTGHRCGLGSPSPANAAVRQHDRNQATSAAPKASCRPGALGRRGSPGRGSCGLCRRRASVPYGLQKTTRFWSTSRLAGERWWGSRPVRCRWGRWRARFVRPV